MLFLMLAAVLFALLIGALAFVTGPVGLTMAAVIGVWLLLYAARGMLHRSRSGGRRVGGSVGLLGSSAYGTDASARQSTTKSSVKPLSPHCERPSSTPSSTSSGRQFSTPAARRTSEVVHHV